MLRLSPRAHAEMVARAYDGLPDEACGLLGGRPGEHQVAAFVPCRNADASARTYSISIDGWKAADDRFGPAGLEVVGVMHSHTHTDAFPSTTDVGMADPFMPDWHYIIVSLRDDAPVLRSFLIADGEILEEAVALDGW